MSSDMHGAAEERKGEEAVEACAPPGRYELIAVLSIAPLVAVLLALFA